MITSLLQLVEAATRGYTALLKQRLLKTASELEQGLNTITNNNEKITPKLSHQLYLQFGLI